MQPPTDLDPAGYRAWLIATDRQLLARDWTPPPAIEGRPVDIAALDRLPRIKENS